MKKLTAILILSVVLTGCSKVPSTSVSDSSYPSIFPDNIGITVPANISPTNFLIQDNAQKHREKGNDTHQEVAQPDPSGRH